MLSTINNSNKLWINCAYQYVNDFSKLQLSNSGGNNQERKCEKVGYFRHEEDCKKFYRCYEMGSHLVRKDFDCAPSHAHQPTAFDEDPK